MGGREGEVPWGVLWWGPLEAIGRRQYGFFCKSVLWLYSTVENINILVIECLGGGNRASNTLFSWSSKCLVVVTQRRMFGTLGYMGTPWRIPQKGPQRVAPGDFPIDPESMYSIQLPPPLFPL